jgi:2-hydroxychromene-2-carboxylate isomerase
MREYISKTLMPQLLIASFRARWPQRLRAQADRALGRRGRIDLYFAYDDPYAAIALPGLLQIAARRRVELKLLPVIERGIDGDPAAQARAPYALEDSRRLAARDGRKLMRTRPLQASETDFLARWSAAAGASPQLARFTAAALDHLWFRSDGPLQRSFYESLFQRHFGTPPPADSTAQAASLAANRRDLLRKGQWESPAARVCGEWFFAHERLAQIDERLQELGY